MKRYIRCEFPKTIPGIPFDKNGTCKFCLGYNKNKRIVDKNFQEMMIHDYCLNKEVVKDNSFRVNGLEWAINDAKEKKKCDCLIGISGGRDNLFVLYTAKKTFGLNVLAFNWDNGFQSRQAFENIKKTCEISNVDCISVSSKKIILEKLHVLVLRRLCMAAHIQL